MHLGEGDEPVFVCVEIVKRFFGLNLVLFDVLVHLSFLCEYRRTVVSRES